MSNQDTETQSRRFAKRVLDSIRAAGRTTDAEVAAVGGPSDSYMTTLRKAAAGEVLLPEPRGHTQKRIEQAAGWMPGSVLKVWSGDEPTLAARLPRDLQPADNRRESLAASTGPSDQELMQRLWSLLDERGAIDMFVSDALEAVERRLSEVRVERNRLAHGAGQAAKTEATQDAEVDMLVDRAVREVLMRLAVKVDTDDDASSEDLALAARAGISKGRQLRSAQDLAGEESQDPDA